MLLSYIHSFLLLHLVHTIIWGVAGGDGKLGCLCGKAGTSHLCDGSARSSGCVVNGYNRCLLIVRVYTSYKRCVYDLSSVQTHRETLQSLMEGMYALFQSRFVQEQESDSLRESLDHCIKLLHKCCEIITHCNHYNMNSTKVQNPRRNSYIDAGSRYAVHPITIIAQCTSRHLPLLPTHRTL